MSIRLSLPLIALLATAPSALAQHHGSHAGHAAPKPAPAEKAVDASTRLAPEHFGRLDTDGDGHVSLSELPEGHPLRDHFSMADRNRDGRLDRREFAALIRMQ